MRPSRNRHEASDLDLEAAFAPEPELRMHGPASIVPEPIEEFADEPGGTPESVPQTTSRPTLERIPLPALEPDLPLIPRTVPLAERPLLIRSPVEPPPIYYPSRPRTVGQTLLPVFQGTVTLACVAAFVWLVVLPYQQGGETATAVQEVPASETAALPPPSAAAPAPDLTPPAPLRPAHLQTADVAPATLPEPEPATQPPGRPVRASEARASRAPEPPTKRVDLQKQTQAARSTPDTKKPDVVAATRTAATAPVTPEADSRRAAPTPDASRAQTDTVSGLGQPGAPPAAESAPLAASRDRAAAPAPAPEAPARPVPTSGNTVTDIRSADRDKVRSVLSRYESAFSQLDAAAAARLYPGVDRKALSRAFGTLSSQQIQFDDCRILVTQSTASATCAGKASWTPKVGGGAKEQARRWQFDLKQVAGDWQIGSVRVQ
jgi:hypothetical protein